MALDHAQQRRNSKATSLVNAGIGRGFHTRRLSELQGTEPLVAWIKSDARKDITAGQGWTIVGSGAPAYDVTLLLARAVHLSDLAVCVVSLVRLVKWIEYEGEDFERAANSKALFITDLFQVYGGNASPLTGWQIAAMEDFINHRLDGNGAIFPHVARLSGETWWSAAFVQRVAQANRKFEVK